MLVPIVLALGVSDPGAKPKEEGLRLADVAPTKRRLGGDDDDSRSDDDSPPRDFTFTCKQKYCGCDCTVVSFVADCTFPFGFCTCSSQALEHFG